VREISSASLQLFKQGQEVPVSFSKQFLDETLSIVSDLNTDDIDAVALGLAKLRVDGGRLFILGVGGSAGHASHAVNDFRKICDFEAYAPTDNVSELTARTNDDGWETTFSNWLKGSRVRKEDGLLIFSVGGGDKDNNVSMNIVSAIDVAKAAGASVYGIVGRAGGYTKLKADACVVIAPKYAEHITPHTEGLAAVVWHLLVSHPALKVTQTKWESMR
jgi:D-sedoheptulose 7-phosphate isomerase